MSKRLEIQVSSKYTTRSGEEKWRNTTVGSAWANDNGSISLVLNPGIAISCADGARITLREPFDRDKPGYASKPRQQSTPEPAEDFGDLPF